MWVIAINTIKEFVRNKILYIFLGIAIGLIFFCLVLSQLALSEQKKIIIDFSFTIIELFGLISTLFLGSNLLYNEISKNTILIILSKNPSRARFIIGKFIGFSIILFLLYLILGFAFLLVIKIHQIIFIDRYVWALVFSYLKILVILGFIIFFSSFMSPFICLLVSLAIYLIAHMTAFFKFYSLITQRVIPGSVGAYIVDFIYYFFPNFQDLSMKDYLLSSNLGNYSYLHISLSLSANILYIIILLSFAVIIFQKREF